MSYTALYRKWRPQSFPEVVGQTAVVKTLTNQVNNNRIGHAYLFCGTRGTGKTTIAKIFARAVNCEHPVNGSPCNECQTCRNILNGTSMNVVEIDAASNNGVENIREIREEVKYSPTEGHYRVYIIDEVHMLSTGAYNALLKTLEEPPEYVIFILATTEVHKIPVTVLSRCQRYDFKRISAADIEGQLQKLTTAENIQAEPGALKYISRAADGAMRDALSILEECVSYHYGQTLTYENVLEIVGAVDTEVFSSLLKSILEKNVPEAMNLVESLVYSGRNISQSVGDFVWFLRNLLMIQTSEVTAEDLGVTREMLEELKNYALRVNMDVLLKYIGMFSDLANSLRTSTEKRTLLEVTIIRAMKPESDMDITSLRERVMELENAIADISDGKITAVTRTATTNELEEKPEEVRVPVAVAEDMGNLQKNWRTILKNGDGLFQANVDSFSPSFTESEGFVVVVKKPFTTGIIKDRIEYLEKAASAALKKEIHFQVKSDAETKTNKVFVGDPTVSLPGVNFPNIGSE